MSKTICLAIAAAISMTACSKPQSENVDSTTVGTAAGQMSGPDSLRAAGAGTTGTGTTGDSASRNTNDTSRVGRDTGRKSQAPYPNKQP